MNLKTLSAAAIAAACVAGPAAESLAAESVYIPLFSYRTGNFAPNGIPVANGFGDYAKLLNERDGGIEGVKIDYDECETGYSTPKGVECYQRVKGSAPVMLSPFSTGITYELIPKAREDSIPILSMGYGDTRAANGAVYKWAFNAPMTYWNQATAITKYVAEQEGGIGNMKDQAIGLIYLDVAYGREPIPTMEKMSEEFSFGFLKYPVPVDSMASQGSIWLDIVRDNPDYLYMWGWGIMNSTAVKEAINNGYPMDRFIGNWWSGAEPDVIPAGKGAAGYKAATFNAPGSGFEVHQQILDRFYGGDEAKAKENNWGEVLYNRGIVNAMYITEAVRDAIRAGNEPTPEAVRDAFETMEITDSRIKELGMEGLAQPIQITCSNHEGTNGRVAIQEWDGEKWTIVSNWIAPMRDITAPLIKEASLAYAKENNLEVRDCN